MKRRPRVRATTPRATIEMLYRTPMFNDVCTLTGAFPVPEAFRYTTLVDECLPDSFLPITAAFGRITKKKPQ